MFSTWTKEEYRALLGYKRVNQTRREVTLDTENLADSIDWRTKGAVNPVKN